MAEGQRADQQTRHDLVADAETQRGVEHVVRSATAVAIAITSRLNSDSSMPGRPWVTPSHIAGTPPANCATAPASRAAILISAGIALERLVRREHVVVGRYDREVRPGQGAQRLLVALAGGREAVRQIGARPSRARAAPPRRAPPHATEIIVRACRWLRARIALGDVGDVRVQRRDREFRMVHGETLA